MAPPVPAFASLALVEIPDPDFADMSISILPAHATADPAAWARSLFSLETMPKWVLLAMVLRQVLVPVRGRVAVLCQHGDEALLAFQDKHLDLAVAVGVNEQNNTVRVTTTVRIKNRLGRLAFAPVRILHPLVIQSMLKRSRKLLSGVTR